MINEKLGISLEERFLYILMLNLTHLRGKFTSIEQENKSDCVLRPAANRRNSLVQHVLSRD